LLAAAVRRGGAVAGPRVVVVTAEAQVAATRDAVPGVELIAEPVARNTAAALGVALAAVERDDVIGTIGIAPTRAETGFGYLEVERAELGAVAPVLRFVEKPDRATAEQYLASGRYLWNAGIFCVSAARLLRELDEHLPATGRAARRVAAGDPGATEAYAQVISISIDHAVMERAARVVTVPAAVGWDDVGSWAALPALRGVDGDGNTTAGEAVIVGGTGNIAIGGGDAVIALVGVSDLVVVSTGDAILVIPKSEAQDVRKVVEALSARGLARYL
jgi:mannose-1-phosphate guanylyltransferase